MSASNSPIRPILSMAVDVRSDADREKFLQGLDNLVHEDEAVRIETDSSNGRIILSGMSESHLRGICFRVMGEHNVPVALSKPRVMCLETIRAHSVGEGRYLRQTGGSGNYGHVILRIQPLERGRGFEFAHNVEWVGIPERYLRPIERGIREVLHRGILAGHEIVDVKATLIGGSHHAKDSNETAFQIAASIAFQEAARKASPAILEPLMSVEVVVPEKYVGAVMGDLNRRGGRCEGIEDRPWAQAVRAVAPLAALIGYAAELSSITQGFGESSMELARYELAHRDGWHGDEEAGTPVLNPRGPSSDLGLAAASAEADFEESA